MCLCLPWSKGSLGSLERLGLLAHTCLSSFTNDLAHEDACFGEGERGKRRQPPAGFFHSLTNRPRPLPYRVEQHVAGELVLPDLALRPRQRQRLLDGRAHLVVVDK